MTAGEGQQQFNQPTKSTVQSEVEGQSRRLAVKLYC
jgi:hypothetical protein